MKESKEILAQRAKRIDELRKLFAQSGAVLRKPISPEKLATVADNLYEDDEIRSLFESMKICVNENDVRNILNVIRENIEDRFPDVPSSYNTRIFAILSKRIVLDSQTSY